MIDKVHLITGVYSLWKKYHYKLIEKKKGNNFSNCGN